MDTLDPPIVSQSFPARPNKEMSRYPASDSPITDEDWPQTDPLVVDEDDWLLNGPHDSAHYGCSAPTGDGIYGMGSKSKAVPKQRRRAAGSRSSDGYRSSLANLASRFFHQKEENTSSDDEAPPTIEMKYKRSKLDWIKLVFLPILYILLMGVAIVFAFYTIQGLMDSYSNKVRSVQQVYVNGRYPPIGIAIFPEFADYLGCDYRYYDNLSPLTQKYPNNPGKCNNFQFPTSCEFINMTFNSTAVANLTRRVLLFQGPTLVECKQSLKLRFGIDTSERKYSGIEYILFDDWDGFISPDENQTRKHLEQQAYLAYIEQNRTVYTFPAGFRTWVKLSYSVYERFGMHRNYTEFNIIDSYATYNDYNDTYMPMEILFEWKTNHYDYIQEIVSTTVWSAFGSFCGLLLTIVKVGEFCKAWIRRFRRDKEKKRLHLQKLEEEQKRLVESYRNRKKKKEEAKLKESLEATNTIAISSKTIIN